MDWSRWDTPGRTVYGGSTEKCAFMEVLAYVSPDPPAINLEDLFDDVDDTDAKTLAEQIRGELPRCGGMQDRSLPRGWRDARSLYELALPVDGWFVDIAAEESVTELDRQFRHVLGDSRLTTSELAASSDDAKVLTTAIATWIRERVVLFDGSRPHGIVYPSKWGRDLMNWAIWMRRTDDGLDGDLVYERSKTEIGLHTPGFMAAANSHGLRTF